MEIDRLDPTIGGKLHDTKTGTQFFHIKEPKRERWTDEYYKATVDTCFAQVEAKKGIKTYGKRLLVDMSDEYEKCTTLMFLIHMNQKSCPARKNIPHSELLILLKKSGAVKKKKEVRRW